MREGRPSQSNNDDEGREKHLVGHGEKFQGRSKVRGISLHGSPSIKRKRDKESVSVSLTH